MTRPARTVCVLLLALPLAMAGETAARADEPGDTTQIVPPVLHLSMTPVAGGTRVCADGTALAPGSWSLGINGRRSDTSQIGYSSALPPATAFHDCRDVPKAGADAGIFSVSFLFQGGSNSRATVPPDAVLGVTVWSPATQDLYVQTGG